MLQGPSGDLGAPLVGEWVRDRGVDIESEVRAHAVEVVFREDESAPEGHRDVGAGVCGVFEELRGGVENGRQLGVRA